MEEKRRNEIQEEVPFATTEVLPFLLVAQKLLVQRWRLGRLESDLSVFFYFLFSRVFLVGLLSVVFQFLIDQRSVDDQKIDSRSQNRL